MNLDAPGGELLGDDVGGALFVKAELGVGVDVTPDRLQLPVVLANLLDRAGEGGFNGSVHVRFPT
jgi:hypothetical protein